MKIYGTELKRNTLCIPAKDCISSLCFIVLEFGKAHLAGGEGFCDLTSIFYSEITKLPTVENQTAPKCSNTWWCFGKV